MVKIHVDVNFVQQWSLHVFSSKSLFWNKEKLCSRRIKLGKWEEILEINTPKLNNSWTVISVQEIEVHQPKLKDWVNTILIGFLLLFCSLQAQIEWTKVITWQSGKPDITKDFLYCSMGLCTAEHNQPQPFQTRNWNHISKLLQMISK